MDEFDQIYESRTGAETSWRSWFTGYASEPVKLVLSFLFLYTAGAFEALIILLTSEKVPSQKSHPPLPDITLDNLPLMPAAFHISEFILLSQFFGTHILALFHKHGTVILRRGYIICGMTMYLRCLTMYVTQMAVPHPTTCTISEALENGSYTATWPERMDITLQLIKGMGLNTMGVKTCGDYMFSGHSCAITIIAYSLHDHLPQNWFWWSLSWASYLVGIFCVAASREHYTVDVVLGCYVGISTYKYYHSRANRGPKNYRDNPAVSRFDTMLQSPLFWFMEGNTPCVMPNIYVNRLASSKTKLA